MTWLFVSTRPSALITMPVPAACSLLYCSVVLMITRPCSTLLRFPDAPDPPLLGEGTAVLGGGAGAIALLLGCGTAATELDAG